jgi:hemerythrin
MNNEERCIMLPVIKWDDQYSVGIDAIDNDHRMFFEITEMLSCMETYEEVLVIRCLSMFNECLHGHFLREELAMEKANHDNYAEHKRQHDAFKEKIADIMDSYYSGNLNAIVGFPQLICDWALTHIPNNDLLFKGAILPEHVDNRSIAALAMESFKKSIKG